MLLLHSNVRFYTVCQGACKIQYINMLRFLTGFVNARFSKFSVIYVAGFPDSTGLTQFNILKKNRTIIIAPISH